MLVVDAREPPGPGQGGETMRTLDRYVEPLAATEWHVPQDFGTVFRWEYADGRDKLLGLYQKGKRLQWDAAERIDWSQPMDPENPAGLPDEVVPIFGSDVWERLSNAERASVRHHFQAWQMSKFMHGEQGDLICTAKIVQQVTTLEAQFYASPTSFVEA